MGSRSTFLRHREEVITVRGGGEGYVVTRRLEMSDNAGEVAAGKSTAASLECGASRQRRSDRMGFREKPRRGLAGARTANRHR